MQAKDSAPGGGYGDLKVPDDGLLQALPWKR